MSSNSTDRGRIRLINALGCAFDDPGLLEQALTHRSRGDYNNERLEFLGDAVVNMIVADLLYGRRPGASEGDLSRLRARLVREATLADLARELRLGDVVRLGPGELKSGGFLRDSILADAFEAVVGALYLDAGYAAAHDAVSALMLPRIDRLPDADELKDAKTRLQEWLQGRGAERPRYEVVASSGADHARRFTVHCHAPGLPEPVEATAGSRRKAEQRAAAGALERLSGGAAE